MTIRPTKVPGFPKVPASVDPQTRQFLAALVEAVEIRLGRKGDPIDRAITLRELIDSGLAKRLKETPFDPNKVGTTPPGIAPIVPITQPYAPTGFSANGAYSQINLFWNAPFYQGHNQTEIWSHTSDVLGDATITGVATGFTFVDPVGSGVTKYYWVRFVNANGVAGPFNATAGTVGETAVDVDHILNVLTGAITSGQLATSLSTPIGTIPSLTQSVGTINGVLSSINTDLSTINTGLSSINTDLSSINTDLGTINTDLGEINTDLGNLTTNVAANVVTIASMATTASVNTALGNYTTTTSLNANYYTLNEVDTAITAKIANYNSTTIGPNYTNNADLTQNYYTKTQADSAFSVALEEFESETIGPNYTSTADLTTNYYTKTNADGAIAAAIVNYNTNTIGALYTNTADLQTAYYTKTNADGAIAAAVTNYNTNTIGPNYTTTASLVQNYYTKTDADSAFATSGEILQAQVDSPDGSGNKVALATMATVQANKNGDLEGQYTVKIDTNGAVAGFGLASTSTAAGNITSEFIVNADRFAIMRGGTDTSAATVPFTVQATATTINGQSVPAGVYMADAFIKNGSIANAKIGSLNADKITAGTINADRIGSGSIDVNKLNLVGTGANINLESANTGARMVIQGSNIAVYDSSGAIRVKLGAL